jgi:IPT/TIG domain-containing protein
MKSPGFRRLQLGVLAACAAISLGCGESPSSPTATPPVSPTPPPSAPPTVQALAVRSVSPTSGPTVGADPIRVSGTGFQPGAAVLIDGIPAEVRNVTGGITIQAKTPPHTVGTVDLAVTNPDGQTVRLEGGYTYGVFTVTAGATLVTTGTELTVNFSTPGGRGCNGGGDWIAIYPVGAPDETGAANGHSDLWYDHLCGATSGSFRLKAPNEAGLYEFRYMVDDFSVARSNPVEVRSSPPPS